MLSTRRTQVDAMSLVLVVDDDLDLLNLYAELLEGMGLEVVTAPDGLQALRLALELKPDLILTDWRMPRMDGIELCKALQLSALRGRTRIILHSSEDIPEPWCADMCLRKLASPEAIEVVVKGMLESRRSRVAVSAHRHSVHESGVSAL
jgi:CheY-like chemotaxis protein